MPSIGAEPSNITLSAWFNFPAGGADGTHQVFELNGSSALALFESNAQTVLNIAGNFFAPSQATTSDLWHHLALTYDGKDMRTAHAEREEYDPTKPYYIRPVTAAAAATTTEEYDPENPSYFSGVLQK